MIPAMPARWPSTPFPWPGGFRWGRRLVPQSTWPAFFRNLRLSLGNLWTAAPKSLSSMLVRPLATTTRSHLVSRPYIHVNFATDGREWPGGAAVSSSFEAGWRRGRTLRERYDAVAGGARPWKLDR